MQCPERSVKKGDVLHGQILHIFQKAHARTVTAHLQGAFMAAAVIGILVENLPTPTVDPSEAGNRHVLRMPCQEKAAALPAGISVVVLKAAHEIRHVIGVKA